LAILLLGGPLFLFIRPSFAPVLLVLPLLWIVRRYRYGHFLVRTPADWPVLGLMGMALTSLLVTPDPIASLDKVTGLIYAVALFYALLSWDRRQAGLLPLALLVAALGAGAAFISLFGTQWNVKWSAMGRINPYLPQLIRDLPGAELGFNPNTVSGTLITFVPLQICLVWALAGAVRPTAGAQTALWPIARRQRARWLVVAALALTITSGVVLLAQSRAGWLTLILGLLGMAAVRGVRLRVPFLLIAALALLALVALGPVPVSERLVNQNWMTSSAEASWAARVERWSRWLWGITEFPLTGTGMDTFRWSAWDKYPFYHTPLTGDLGHAHNNYLQTALDLGIPGLVSYLALVGSALVLGWRRYRRTMARQSALITLGATTGLATHAAWSVIDALPLGARTNFLWWAMLAMVMGCILQAQAIITSTAPAAAGAPIQRSMRTMLDGGIDRVPGAHTVSQGRGPESSIVPDQKPGAQSRGDCQS
jgi:putative inorganic carbon (HCO3(-)) transporter